MDIINIFLQIHFVIMVLGIILISLYAVNLKKLFSYLESNYPEKYQELGRPSFTNVSILTAYKLLKFLGQSFQESDAILQKNIKKTKIFLISGSLMVLIGILNFFIFNSNFLPHTTVTRGAVRNNSEVK